ncbi:MAG: hypothetical protein AB7G21_00930 [Dehalococcoidia bacterium]
MKHLVPLVLAAALLVGCAPPREAASTATGTVGAAGTGIAAPSAIATATPMPRTTPPSATRAGTRSDSSWPTVRAWANPPSSGAAHVDLIVSALIASDASRLEPYITGISITCGFQDGPECPPAVPLETPVPAFGSGACPGGGSWTRLGPPAVGTYTTAAVQAQVLAELQLRFLRAVYALKPGDWRYDRGIRYSVVLQRQQEDVRGVYLEVTGQGIATFVVWGDGTRCGVEAGVLVPPPPQSP